MHFKISEQISICNSFCNIEMFTHTFLIVKCSCNICRTHSLSIPTVSATAQKLKWQSWRMGLQDWLFSWCFQPFSKVKDIMGMDRFENLLTLLWNIYISQKPMYITYIPSHSLVRENRPLFQIYWALLKISLWHIIHLKCLGHISDKQLIHSPTWTKADFVKLKKPTEQFIVNQLVGTWKGDVRQLSNMTFDLETWAVCLAENQSCYYLAIPRMLTYVNLFMVRTEVEKEK